MSITSNGSIANHRPVPRHLDDDVELGGAVVDDAEPDAVVVQPRRDVQVGAGGIEMPLGWLCSSISPALPSRPGSASTMSTVPRATHARRGDDAVAIHVRDEGDFAAARGGDLGREVGPDARGDALRRRWRQVFSSFFFAAGKSTLLRISR